MQSDEHRRPAPSDVRSFQHHACLPNRVIEKLRHNPRLLPASVAFIIIVIGALGRLTALDWDSMAGLHADERHMAFMVSGAIRGLKAWSLGELPLSWIGLWFDAEHSPLNPRLQSGFYIYGEAPLLVMALWAHLWGWFEWTDIFLYGRMLSALADCGTMILVFFIAAKWTKSLWAPVLACGFYACLPVALREAHFFTVDTLSAAFGTAAFYAASFWNDRASPSRNSGIAVVVGLLLGLSVACKLSGAFFAVAILFIILVKLRLQRQWSYGAVAGQALACLLAALLAFRLANPFAFAGKGFWGLALDPRFLDDVAEQSRLANAGIGWVPNWFWLEREPFLLVSDIVIWGFGPCFVLAVLLAVVLRWRSLSPGHVAGIGFIVVVLTILATYPTPYLRYTLPIAPVAAVIAGQMASDLSSRAWLSASVLLLVGSAIQAGAVLNILRGPHTRVEASVYIWRTLPLGSTILNETGWDETLPAVVRLPGDKEARWPFVEGAYKLSVLQIQEPDGPEKAKLMAERLAGADLLVQSSQRFSDVIPRLADRFPMSSRYYAMLKDGRLCFEEIREFRRGLRLAGLMEVDDSRAQESWFIYDHPVVKLYRKTACFDRAEVERTLLDALPR